MEHYYLKIPPGHKAGACAGNELGSRLTHFAAILPGKESAYVASTDGRCLSVLPVAFPSPPAPILLPPECVNANGKEKFVDVGYDVKATSGKECKVYPLPAPDGYYPALASAFPSHADLEYGACAFILDAKMFSRLASAISGDGKVIVLVPKPEKGSKIVSSPLVLVGLPDDTAYSSSLDGIGLIVPMDLKEEQRSNALGRFVQVKADMPTDRIKFEAPKLAP